MIETILVATDGSEAASTAESCAIALASKLRARLSGITVVEDRDVNGPTGDGLGVQGFPASELAAFHKARSEAISSRFSQRASSGGVTASCEIAAGVACDRIVERSQAAGLTVAGRDGKGARGALIGSTIDAVACKSAKSILVVPAGAPVSGGFGSWSQDSAISMGGPASMAITSNCSWWRPGFARTSISRPSDSASACIALRAGPSSFSATRSFTETAILRPQILGRSLRISRSTLNATLSAEIT